ncbi:MAG: DUF1611 domain-containing protein [Nitrospinae bacterium]|nr:DUF1611 domain-containing protein [Nitrospinota bacterium]
MKRKILIYAEGKLGLFASKTGNCAIRYFPDEIAAVIDSSKKGGDLFEFIGAGKGVPIVGCLAEALRFRPDTFLVGSAPIGGAMNAHLLDTVKEAIANKMNVLSGLHNFFSDMPEIAGLAKAHGVKITDLRKPAPDLKVAKSKWKEIRAKVVLSVGSDCNSGKLSTIYEIFQAFRKRGIPSNFIGTGQTGILLAGGEGVPADAVVSDFLAGAVEAEIEKSDRKGVDFIFVEGQGALTHSAYSGVTLGLLHGSMPDAMVFCLDATREYDDWGNRIPDLKKMIDFHETAMSFFKDSKVLGLGVITHRIQDESKARQAIRDIGSYAGLPANDPYRFGCENIVDSLLKFFVISK